MSTTTKYRYSLEEGSKKFRCPACNQKRLVRYLDNETGDYLADDIGRCDREIECGYHKPPREVDGLEISNTLYSVPEQQPPKPSILPYKYVQRTMGNYKTNTLICWLATLSGWDWKRAESVARLYKVGTGTTGDVEGWAIFWQIDDEEQVRSGKMIRYDETGHRMKEGYCYDWIHSRLLKSGHLDEFELVQCFFGLHLVDGSKPVAIVESEKTAIIASVYLTQFHWLASGQLNGLQKYKFLPLRGMPITLFPDIGAYDKWKQKATELPYRINVSSLLEEKAPDEHIGYDLADYLVQFDINEFCNTTRTPDSIHANTTRQGHKQGGDKLLERKFEAQKSAGPAKIEKNSVKPDKAENDAPESRIPDSTHPEYETALRKDPILQEIDRLFDPEIINETQSL